MENDPYYRSCALRLKQGKYGVCNGRVEWHHAFIFGGRQVNEKWCILPMCSQHHRIADRRDIKEETDRIMLNRAPEETLKKYSKAVNLIEKRDRLNECG